MTFEEKKIKAFEKSIYSMTPDKNTYEALQGAFDLAWKLARQETLREVIPVLEKIKPFMELFEHGQKRMQHDLSLQDTNDAVLYSIELGKLLKKLEAEQ